MITFVLRRDNAGIVARRLDQALRVALGLGMVAAVAWAIGHDTAPCSVADPSVCGADAVMSGVVGMLFAVPVLLWLAPVLACATLVALAVVDVVWDRVGAAHGPFVALGVLAVAVALLHRRLDRAVQAHVPAVPAPAYCPTHLSDREWDDVVERDEGFLLTTAAATGLLLAVLTAAIGVTAVQADAAHRARAVRVPAVVTAHHTDDEENTTVTARAADGRTWDLDVLDFRPYAVGSSTAVAVDPRDPDWFELVAEEHDPTPWFTACVAAALLGLGAGARAFAAGSRAPRGDTVQARSPRRDRLQAGLVTTGAIVAGPAGMWFADSWPERVTAGLGAANAAWVGTARWARGFDASASRLVLHTAFWSRDLAWRSVRQLQTSGATVTVADDRGDVHVFGPLQHAADDTTLDHTARVGDRLAAWRADPPTTRGADRPPRRRLAPTGLVTGGVVVLECAVGVLAAV